MKERAFSDDRWLDRSTKGMGAMAAIPESVKNAWLNREGPVILATVDGSGVPNVIYVTCVGSSGEDCLVVADNYMHKTRSNLNAGSHGAILFQDKTGKAYQVKGPLTYHSDGEIFDEMKRWNPSKHPGHAAVVLHVQSAYSGAEQLA